MRRIITAVMAVADYAAIAASGLFAGSQTVAVSAAGRFERPV